MFSIGGPWITDAHYYHNTKRSITTATQSKTEGTRAPPPLNSWCAQLATQVALAGRTHKLIPQTTTNSSRNSPKHAPLESRPHPQSYEDICTFSGRGCSVNALEKEMGRPCEVAKQWWSCIAQNIDPALAPLHAAQPGPHGSGAISAGGGTGTRDQRRSRRASSAGR
jgi:hypothetical protein